MSRRFAGRWGLILLAVAIALIAAPGSSLASQRASLPDVEDEVMCTVCGTLLELSDSPQAARERALIRKLIAEGRTKDEIKAALVDEYGRDVLAVPEGNGFDLAAWIVPALGFALALGLLGLGAWRLRRSPPPTSPPLSDQDAGRVERDLSSYDL